MEGLFKLLPDLVEKKVSDIHIHPGEVCFIRKYGSLEPLTGISFTEDEVKKLILGTSSPRAREILGKSRQVAYAFEEKGLGRFRFSVFFAKNKFSVAIRVIPDKPPTLLDLGLPDVLKKVLSKSSGLVIVGSPSGHGKTTTIASLLGFLNSHFEKSVVTIENPVEIRFRDEMSTFVQRSIPLDVSNFYQGLVEAYRLYPDVVMTDSINYNDAFDQALFLCESGCLVIAATDGGSCQQILERLICSRPKEERDSLRGKLASQLALIISQRLAPRNGMLGRTPVFDILVNTNQVKTLIRNENLVMLKTLQEQDQASGMQTCDGHLLSLAQKGVISSETAVALADEPQEMQMRFPKK